MPIDLAAIVRSVLPILDESVSSFQVSVTQQRYTGQDSNGQPQYDPTPIERLGTEEHGTRMVSRKGQMVSIAAVHLVFTTPFAVDVRDQFTASDGATGPIVHVKWVTDPLTLSPFATEVWIGRDPL